VSNLELFLCGDVMTGRGVDQAFARSCPPTLHEPLVRSALEYVELAERAHGAIPRPIDHDYVWGDALGVLERKRPDVRIVNLETSITTSERAEPKGINYRMHPENVAVLSAAAIDCCVLSNNHVLDYGVDGLVETLAALEHSGIATAGAGRNLAVARAPAACDTGVGGRVLVFGLGVGDSGIPESWLAEPGRPGVHLLPDLSDSTVDSIAALVAEAKQRSDVVVASVHWGANWGYDIPVAHRRFLAAERQPIRAISDREPREICDVLAQSQLPVHVQAR
jgi:poly-gamma-glutamate synthesis protein (capsule biosynthesis protein)